MGVTFDVTVRGLSQGGLSRLYETLRAIEEEPVRQVMTLRVDIPTGVVDTEPDRQPGEDDLTPDETVAAVVAQEIQKPAAPPAVAAARPAPAPAKKPAAPAEPAKAAGKKNATVATKVVDDLKTASRLVDIMAKLQAAGIKTGEDAVAELLRIKLDGDVEFINRAANLSDRALAAWASIQDQE